MAAPIMAGIGALVTGSFTTAIGLAKDLLNLLKGIGNLVLQFDQMGTQTAKNIGVNAQQSLGLTKALVSQTKDLAAQYGVTAEQIAKIQDSINNATGRAIILSERQKESMLQTEKFLGDGVQAQFVENLANLGSDLDTARNAMMGAITSASSMGLVTSKASAELAKNLKLANQLPFQNGIDGLTKMTMLSQRLRFNLENVANVADKFNTIEGSIESSAQMQLLGGQYAIYGSNPMEMLYEANNDPEALTERLTKMFSGKGTFDTKTGEVKMSGYQMQMMREAAKAMGMDPNETIQMNKASIRNRQVDAQLTSAPNLSDELKAFVENKAQYDTKTGQFKVTELVNGETVEHNVSELSAQDIERIQKQSALTTEQAVIQASQQVVSAIDRMKAITDMIGAMLSELLLPYLPDFLDILMEIPNLVGEAYLWLQENVGQMTTADFWLGLIGKAIMGAVTFLVKMIWAFIKGMGEDLYDAVITLPRGIGRTLRVALSRIPGIGKFFGSKEENDERWENAKQDLKKGGLGLAFTMLNLSSFVTGGMTGAFAGAAKVAKVGSMMNKAKATRSIAKATKLTNKSNKTFNKAIKADPTGASIKSQQLTDKAIRYEERAKAARVATRESLGKANTLAAKGAKLDKKAAKWANRNIGAKASALWVAGRASATDDGKENIKGTANEAVSAVSQELPTFGKIADKTKDVASRMKDSMQSETFKNAQEGLRKSQAETNEKIRQEKEQYSESTRKDTTERSTMSYSERFNKAVSAPAESTAATTASTVNNESNVANTTVNSGDTNTTENTTTEEITLSNVNDSIKSVNENVTKVLGDQNTNIDEKIENINTGILKTISDQQITTSDSIIEKSSSVVKGINKPQIDTRKTISKVGNQIVKAIRQINISGGNGTQPTGPLGAIKNAITENIQSLQEFKDRQIEISKLKEQHTKEINEAKAKHYTKEQIESIEERQQREVQEIIDRPKEKPITSSLFNGATSIAKSFGNIMTGGLFQDVVNNFNSNPSVVPQGEKPNVSPKPYTGKVQIYRTSSNKDSLSSNVKVDDFNINISGTLNLQAPNGKNVGIDVNSLVNDYQFRSSLVEMLKRELPSANSGRFKGKDYTQGKATPNVPMQHY